MNKFNDHQIRIWKDMIRDLESYSKEDMSFRHLVGALESAIEAGEFKNEELLKKWYEFWEPLEIYNAVMLDRNEKPKKEYIIDKVESMRNFLLEQLALNDKE